MESIVREAWERGRARWPDLALALADFAAALEAGVTTDQLQAEDLYLARACVAQVTGAAEAFAAEFRAPLAMFAGTILKDRAASDELAAQLLVELLVGDAQPPRLAGYLGRGPLRAWLRMTTVRRALNSKRDHTRRNELDGNLMRAAIDTANDPETALLKQTYGAAFETAFRDSLAALASADRALLRLHYGEGLPLAVLCKIHGWSKPTASRRVAAAREALLDHTIALVRERLKLSDSEMQSVIRLIRSNLEVSLTGLLQSNVIS